MSWTEAEANAKAKIVENACHEMGYDSVVVVAPDGSGGWDFGVMLPESIQEMAVAFNAIELVAPNLYGCWTCSMKTVADGSSGLVDRCIAGDCANLGPKKPPRELLVRGPWKAA